VVELWGRHWSRRELLARVGRLDQVAGVQLTEAADGAERGVGFPVVDASAELAYPAGPGTCVSDACADSYRTLAGPQPDFVEECYERGELGYLQPREQRHYDLEVGALTDTTAIDDFASRVNRLAELARA
jgi:hypothetical protein